MYSKHTNKVSWLSRTPRNDGERVKMWKSSSFRRSFLQRVFEGQKLVRNRGFWTSRGFQGGYWGVGRFSALFRIYGRWSGHNSRGIQDIHTGFRLEIIRIKLSISMVSNLMDSRPRDTLLIFFSWTEIGQNLLCGFRNSRWAWVLESRSGNSEFPRWACCLGFESRWIWVLENSDCQDKIGFRINFGFSIWITDFLCDCPITWPLVLVVRSTVLWTVGSLALASTLSSQRPVSVLLIAL